MLTRRSLLTGFVAAFAAPVVARFAPAAPFYEWDWGTYDGVRIIERPLPPPIPMARFRELVALARAKQIPPIEHDGQPHYLLVWSAEEQRYVFRASV